MLRIAVTGPKGRLGSQLILLGCTPMECDITDTENIELSLAITKPDVIINCAAYTDVDACETEPGWKKATAVNYRGVEKLRNAFSGKLIHISTDYVFDGKGGPYTENNAKNKSAVNQYGSSKLGGEIVLLNPLYPERPTCIVRTTGLYGSTMRRIDVAHKVKDALSSGKILSISRELMGNQTYIPHLAEALVKLAGMEWNHKIIHIASDDVLSRYEFALMVASMFGLDKELIIPVRNKEVPNWLADRPTKAGLRTTLAKKLRLPIYTVLDGLKRFRDDTRGI